MKKYYVYYYADFRNTYNLISVDQSSAADLAAFDKLNAKSCYERITLEKAKELCRSEREREKYDPACAGFGSSTIIPAAELCRLAALYR